MPQQKDIVKIAIQMPGAYPQLIQLDQKKPLSAVIKEVCDGWNLPGSENYALQYADGVQMYITESVSRQQPTQKRLSLAQVSAKTSSTRPESAFQMFPWLRDKHLSLPLDQ